MSEKKHTFFGMLPDGTEAELCHISSEMMQADISTLGATIVRIKLKDADGLWTDVALGFDTAQEYLTRPGNLGATIGRYAGRIANGTFPLNGEIVSLLQNRGSHTIHGGPEGFHRRLWAVTGKSDKYVEMELRSHDGDQGFPGNLTVQVVFSVDSTVLKMDAWAVSDKDTVCSLTNHVYWNLAGHDRGTIDGHLLVVPAKAYLETDSEKIPTGNILPVGTGMPDLQAATPLEGLSFDHTYLLAKDGDLHFAAWAMDRFSGRQMKLWTDLPAVQVYTADSFPENTPGKSGANYGPRSGFCLEAQYYPDSPNHPDFPSVSLKANEKVHHQIYWEFDLRKEEC